MYLKSNFGVRLRVMETRQSRRTFFLREEETVVSSVKITYLRKKSSNVFSFLLPAGIRRNNSFLPQNSYISFQNKVDGRALILDKLKRGHWYFCEVYTLSSYCTNRRAANRAFFSTLRYSVGLSTWKHDSACV